MRALADKIAAKLPAHSALVLEANNISSLTDSDLRGLRQALQSELAHRGFRLASSSSAGLKLHVTLSESVEGYVWVAEWRQKDEPQVAVLFVPRTADLADKPTKETLSLATQLIWQQPAKFLDFALLPRPAASSYSTLVVLEPGAVVFYDSGVTGWRRSRTLEIPRAKPWPRDASGRIASDGGTVVLDDVQCPLEGRTSGKVECVPLENKLTGVRIDPRIPGRDGSEIAALLENCNGGSVVLATGMGDWTQPDSIQGYLWSSAREPAAESGSPMEMAGPVISLHSSDSPDSARAVVRSLRTNNYEAYVVTATCHH